MPLEYIHQTCESGLSVTSFAAFQMEETEVMSIICWTSNDTLIHRCIRSLEKRTETVFGHFYCGGVENRRRKYPLKFCNHERVNNDMLFRQSVLFLNQGNACNLIANLNEKRFSIVLIPRSTEFNVCDKHGDCVRHWFAVDFVLVSQQKSQTTNWRGELNRNWTHSHCNQDDSKDWRRMVLLLFEFVSAGKTVNNPKLEPRRIDRRCAWKSSIFSEQTHCHDNNGQTNHNQRAKLLEFGHTQLPGPTECTGYQGKCHSGCSKVWSWLVWTARFLWNNW